MRRSRAFSLVELMIVLAIMGVITPVMVMLLTSVTKGFTGYEAALSMRKVNQQSINRIYMRLGSCKRIFENSTNDLSYLNKITFSAAPVVSTITVQLPTINRDGTLAEGTTNFDTSSVGNALLFATNEMVQAMSSSTYRVDIYRFNYYYLTSANTKTIDAGVSYKLVEWRSVSYADINQLNSIPVSSRTIVGVQLYTMGVKYAWDPTMTTATNAFYTISSAGSVAAYSSPKIVEYKYKILTDMITGVIIGGYSYGVSRNSSGWAKAPKTVPLYAAIANTSIPFGFEVAVAGNSAGRQVLLRCVLVAQGTMKAIVGDDLQVVASARDLW